MILMMVLSFEVMMVFDGFEVLGLRCGSRAARGLSDPIPHVDYTSSFHPCACILPYTSYIPGNTQGSTHALGIIFRDFYRNEGDMTLEIAHPPRDDFSEPVFL